MKHLFYIVWFTIETVILTATVIILTVILIPFCVFLFVTGTILGIICMLWSFRPNKASRYFFNLSLIGLVEVPDDIFSKIKAFYKNTFYELKNNIKNINS